MKWFVEFPVALKFVRGVQSGRVSPSCCNDKRLPGSLRRMQWGVTTLAILAAVITLGAHPVQAAYVEWTPAMTSSHSSDLGGYPAQNAFDSRFTPGGWRGDWTFEFGSAQGPAGFSLGDTFHGNWHSLNDPSLKQSPSGTMAREWIAADFGEVLRLSGVDVWNSNWSVINATRAVKGMSIDVSADGVNWTNVWTGDLTMAPGVTPHLIYDGVTYVNPNLGPGHPPQFGLLATDEISFGAAVDARYVSFNMQTNHGGDPYFAIDEIRFVQIPEPTSAVISLSALLGMVGAYRTRR